MALFGTKTVPSEHYPVQHTDEEWADKLTPEQFRAFGDQRIEDALRGWEVSGVFVDEMDLLDPHGSSHWAVVAALKRALDPDGVLAPGRYEPAVAAALRAPAAG